MLSKFVLESAHPTLSQDVSFNLLILHDPADVAVHILASQIYVISDVVVLSKSKSYDTTDNADII
jgi:hypothetical protein